MSWLILIKQNEPPPDWLAMVVVAATLFLIYMIFNQQ